MRNLPQRPPPEPNGPAFVSAHDQPDLTEAAAQRRRHWQRNLQFTGALMVLWFVVSFVLTYFARDLNFPFFGWPFSYWVGAQGAILVYLLIVGLYAHVMDRLDRAHGVAEDD